MTNTVTETGKNTNCLKGVKCPKCGQEDTFKIEASCLFTVTDDGTEDEGNGHEWDDTNYCECFDCGYHGTVADFTIEEWGKKKEAATEVSTLEALELAEKLMTHAKRTPEPWKRSERIGYTIRITARGRGIAFIDTPSIALDHEDEANAEFIVRACNAHDDLLAALEGALRGIINPCAHPTAQQARIKQARAAIVKARG
jgi:hypothetical protein